MSVTTTTSTRGVGKLERMTMERMMGMVFLVMVGVFVFYVYNREWIRDGDRDGDKGDLTMGEMEGRM